jgi:tRNA (guanine37-N1)-methyltransferase
MTFDIVTIFPAMVEQAVAVGIVGRAIERGTLGVTVHDLRTYTTDRHHVVDDVPYGGGPGMVMKAEPLFRALDVIARVRTGRRCVVLTSPQGRPLTQDLARKLSGYEHVVLLCGRYEGVDERVRSRVDQEVSIGDYVLSGGELPPHYTRPAEVPGPSPVDAAVAEGEALKVPDVLLSGNHAAIRRWRKRESITRTLARRPELLDRAALDDEELEILRELVVQRDKGAEDGRH